MKFCDGPVSGKILGKDFKADKVELENTVLSLGGGTQKILIYLPDKPGKYLYEFSAGCV
jgi:hypothetical protein